MTLRDKLTKRASDFGETAEHWLADDGDWAGGREQRSESVPTRASQNNDVRPFVSSRLRASSLAAVDAGAVVLGETETHLLIALRATAVIARRQDSGNSDGIDQCEAMTARTGVLPLPLAVEARASVLHEVGSAMGRPDFFVEIDDEVRGQQQGKARYSLKSGSASRATHYADRIRVLLERLMQRAAVEQIAGGTVLLDGALTLRSRDTPDSFLHDLARRASALGNSLVAVSKRSELLVSGRPVRFWLDDTPSAACYRPLTALLASDEREGRHRAERVMGGVYAARLSPMGPTFRVDVKPSRGVSEVEALTQFHASALMRCGYPDLLVQAHALSSFTRADVMSLQAEACARYGLIPVSDISAGLLSGIFAPFGGRYK